MTRCKLALLTSFLVGLAHAFPAMSVADNGTGANHPSTTLAEHVAIEVLGVRVWSPPEQKSELLEKTPDGPYYYFQLDGLPMGGGPSARLQSEGQAETKFLLGSDHKFVRRCVKLTSPKGKYVEILLAFMNNGQEVFKQSITSPSKDALAVGLRVGTDTLPPADFLCPGTSNSRLSHMKALQKRGLTVVTEFKGDLGVYLKGGAKTWLLLLFEVPADSRKGVLKVADADAMEIQWE